MRRILVTTIGFFTTLMLLALAAPQIALAAGAPARTVTIQAGAYVVDVNMSQDPPFVDQPLEFTVVPRDHTLQLSGDIVAQPGLGTDATPLHTNLSAVNGIPNALTGKLILPVRGAWTIQVELNGPKGSGMDSFGVTVAAPGAIPVWLAWLIASLPIIGITWFIWRQHRYRNKLLIEKRALLGDTANSH